MNFRVPKSLAFSTLYGNAPRSRFPSESTKMDSGMSSMAIAESSAIQVCQFLTLPQDLSTPDRRLTPSEILVPPSQSFACTKMRPPKRVGSCVMPMLCIALIFTIPRRAGVKLCLQQCFTRVSFKFSFTRSRKIQPFFILSNMRPSSRKRTLASGLYEGVTEISLPFCTDVTLFVMNPFLYICVRYFIYYYQ